jgi:hypothetical protein
MTKLSKVFINIETWFEVMVTIKKFFSQLDLNCNENQHQYFKKIRILQIYGLIFILKK